MLGQPVVDAQTIQAVVSAVKHRPLDTVLFFFTRLYRVAHSCVDTQNIKLNWEDETILTWL